MIVRRPESSSRGMFLSARPSMNVSGVSRRLGLDCCFRGGVPQGAL